MLLISEYYRGMVTPEEIKEFLKEIGEDRHWLATKTHSTKKTVDGWLSAGKNIPLAKQDIIRALILARQKTQEEDPLEKVKSVSIRFTAEEWNELMQSLGTIDEVERYIRRVTNKAIIESAKKHGNRLEQSDLLEE